MTSKISGNRIFGVLETDETIPAPYQNDNLGSWEINLLKTLLLSFQNLWEKRNQQLSLQKLRSQLMIKMLMLKTY